MSAWPLIGPSQCERRAVNELNSFGTESGALDLALPRGARSQKRRQIRRKSASLLDGCYHLGLPPSTQESDVPLDNISLSTASHAASRMLRRTTTIRTGTRSLSAELRFSAWMM